MGHPAPFNLKVMGIGNEQWGPEYVERLEPFLAAMRKAHPEIKIVGSTGPDSEGDKFDYLWPEMKRVKADLVDEHFYRPEDWFLAQGARYDNYDRKGPKVSPANTPAICATKTGTTSSPRFSKPPS